MTDPLDRPIQHEFLHIGNQTFSHTERKLVGFGHEIFNNNVLTAPDLRVNSHGFRSDEFKKNHDKKHILFSGCSITYGSGLLENEIWAKKLYNRLNIKNDLSGFFNLGLPGISIFEIVANIFRYIDNFNKPDSIFIAMPNYQRRYVSNPLTFNLKDEVANPKNKVFHGVYKNNVKDEFSDTLHIYAYHYLMFLEMFCKSNNIDLFYFCYNNNYIPMELDRFFEIDKKDLQNKLAQFSIDNPNNKYALYARDNAHFGEAYHSYWADFCYKISQEEN
jgi:hypothetical protein